VLKRIDADQEVGVTNMKEGITKKDILMAKWCLNCLVCRRARKKQKGLAFFFVNKVEDKICPFCKAYEKVYGQKAHESVSIH